ncbi:MAG: GNAT family N-acetyltransferase [Bacteriovoracaceae bacterium]|jgi:[ribosomal protein S5]-alanine N-acetyltransferase|nr:GNAT family N-acetyltransferase [Bacteriovoracaceae bacterium]
MELKSKRPVLRDHIVSDWKDSKEFVEAMIKQSIESVRYKFDLAVFHPEDGKVIGGIGIRRTSALSMIADLGYATEAASTIFKFGFEQLGLALIYANCDCENSASYKVMEKLGMRKVGTSLKDKEFKGAWHDRYRYEILNPN